MKKILLSENSEKAEGFIQELERKCLAAVRKAYQGIEDLGIKAPDKKLVFQVIAGNFDSLTSEFWKICQPDIEALTSPVSKNQLKANLESALIVFCESIPMLFAQEIDGRSISDSFFQRFLDYDEKTGPFVSDFTKESIRESYKLYLEDAQHIRVFEAHQAAGKALQKLVDELDKSNLVYGQRIKTQGVLSLFDVEITGDRYHVNPREINYGFVYDSSDVEFASGASTFIPQKKEDIRVNKGKYLK